MDSETTSGSFNLEKLLEERGRLDDIIQKKFTKNITIMFTDMKGSTSIAESEGDVVSRFLIKKHNDIVIPLIDSNSGVLVKTMGDGTLSYFEHARDAVSAAVQIQNGISNFNKSKTIKTSLQVRIGLNSGMGIVEKNDIFGDVVNVASRFETLAGPGEIYISESTYNALSDAKEFYCRFIKTTRLKEKKGIHKVFKVFWDTNEIERDKSRVLAAEGSDGMQQTIALDQFRKEIAAVNEEENKILTMARNLEKDNKLIDLYFLCQEFEAGVLGDMCRDLRGDFESCVRMDTRFNEENALWFFTESVVVGRVSEADFPITNKALSRVPIRVGIKKGKGFLRIENNGTGDVKSVEIERPDKKETVKPNVEYELGTAGKIIFSLCFPLEYSVYKDRLLIMRFINPDELVKKHYNFTLRDVWKDFERESERLIVIGR